MSIPGDSLQTCGIAVENAVQSSHQRQPVRQQDFADDYPGTIRLRLDVQYAGAIEVKIAT